MEQYINYCTEMQTRRAIELGAPIYSTCYGDGAIKQIWYKDPENDLTGMGYYDVPTTQQMRGWLINKGLYIEIALNGECLYKLSVYISTEEDGELDTDIEASDSYKELELLAIDAALDYLENNN